jgi:glycosyltransferase involved in cell wall biosynthesis
MLISIITVNLNNKRGLQKTITSILDQTCSKFEFILIDGGSDDGSVELIKNYSDKLKYWVSEPDKGIYNAMNKGIKIASGDYCLFLNSGDYFYDDKVIDSFNNLNCHEDIISGNILKQIDNEIIEMKSPDSDDLDLSFFFEQSLPHPATFIKRDLLVDLLYNEKYLISSDWDFFLRSLFINNSSYFHIDKIIAVHDGSGISSFPENFYLINSEKENSFRENMPRIFYSFKTINEENIKLKLILNEYLKLKNGRLFFIVKFLLKMKKIFKNFKTITKK